MSSHKQTISVYEYSKYYFEAPLDARSSRDLNVRATELQKHTKSEVLIAIHNNSNQTIGIEARQYVGVIRINDRLTVQILPKMSASDKTDVAHEQSIQNLLYMLNYCGKLVAANTSLSTLKSFKGDFYEILIHLYANTLMTEVKKSLQHEYVNEEHNLPYMKGKLLFSEHILKNAISQDKFYTMADEFIVDTQLNRIFLYVTKLLFHTTRNIQNKRALSELILMFDGVRPVAATVQLANQVVLSRLNIRFGPALELAKLFLSGKTLQLSSADFATTTFLIDMNVLFEEFIAALVKKTTPVNSIVYTQGPRRYLVTGQTGSIEVKNRPAFQMKPDIGISLASNPNDLVHIIDTKYKLLDDTQNKMGVSQQDMYQMYAYSGRYNTSKITLLYPLRADQNVLERTMHIGNDCQIAIRTIDLRRDLKSCLSSLKKDIQAIAWS